MSLSLSVDLETLQPAVHGALRAWRTIGGTSENLLDSLLLVQESRKEVALNGSPAMLRMATNEVLLSAIKEMASKDAERARVLRARFVDRNTIVKAAHRFHLSPDQVNRLQRKGIEQLTEILLGREMAAREQRIGEMQARLQPATYTRLFGFEEAHAKVVEQLLAAGSPWVVGIVGLGGIGKTALADSVTRKIIGRLHFDEVIWLRVEGHGMRAPNLTLESLWASLARSLWPQEVAGGSPAQRAVRVRQALKSKAHLVVIDNLEAEADTAYLLHHLGDLAAPSKFLLTTRTRPPGQAGVFTLSVSELTPHDSAALLRHHAATIGLHDLAEASAADSDAIYDITGGNPLALKLVVSLAAVLPLPQILADLKRSRAGQIEEMYCHIYWKAWQTLTPQARDLLQAMPLVGASGARPKQMQAISELSEAQLWPAIVELTSRSLLEVRGTAWERRYGIHRLTETFLYTEIIHWTEEA
ncbi:MAG: NB-ARC domain-containing protein [Ardenticatenaceae bacterium]